MSNAPTEVTGLVLGYRLSLRTYQVTEGQPASLYSHGRCEAPYLLLRSASHFEKVLYLTVSRHGFRCALVFSLATARLSLAG